MKDKVAVVTGGASGIGAATVREFVARGVAVGIADVNPAGETLASDIRASGGRAIFIPTDVTSEDDTIAMVERAVAEYGRLDFAVNNAGKVHPRGKPHEISVADWTSTIAVNLTGVWLCLRAEVPALIAGGGGVIVNTASIAGLKASAAPRHAGYGASKHGVIGLTKVAARDYAQDGIRVVAVCPGGTDTPILDEALASAGMSKQGLAASGRVWMDPAVPARVIVWLCSSDADYISGEAITIDSAQYA